jgi:hypothetical protein
VIKRARRSSAIWSLVVAGLWTSMLPESSLGQQGMVFAREHISIVLDGASIAVDGAYVLRNPTPHDLVRSLLYPFPVDSTHPFPDSISVWQNQKTVTFARSGDGVIFSVAVAAQQSAVFRVVYTQRCLDNSGCYILTTTSAWKRPLESAEFEVTLAAGVELEWTAYELTPAGNDEGRRTYGLTQQQFMPEQDFCLRWKSPPVSGTSP